jgi:mannose-6-phosphate isomerase
LLLNFVVLEPGEALFLDAGNVHAYLRGLGVEVMAASDNVLRGGLTAKHVDIDALCDVLVPACGPAPVVHPSAPGLGVRRWETPAEEFELWSFDGTTGATLNLGNAPTVVLCASGSVDLASSTSSAALGRGESVFVPASEQAVLRGSGTAYFCTIPRGH